MSAAHRRPLADAKGHFQPSTPILNPPPEHRGPPQALPAGAGDTAQTVARGQLDRSLLGGIAWTAGAKWAGQAISWAVTLIVARILTPADFGIVGMATVYLGLVTLVAEFGLGTAVVTLRDLSSVQLKQINTLSVAFGLAGALLSCALAAPLGRFFHSPRLPLVIIVMSSAFIMMAFQSIPYSLLTRDLRFKLLAGINTAMVLAQAATALVLALLGWGYWALVIGSLVGTAVLSVLPIVRAPQGFARPRAADLGRVMRFSRHVIVTRAAWYGYSNADFVVAGRVLGEAPLGVYTLAWNLASVPLEKITAMLTTVTPSFFSAVQTQHAELRRYLLRMSEGLALVTFPATLGLALVAPDFVQLLLGARWMGAVAPLELLAIYASIRSVVTLLPQVLIAVGETRFMMWVTLLMLLALPPVFWLGSRWGAVGIAAGWVLVYPVLTLPLLFRTLRAIHMRLGEYLRGLWPAASASAVMCVAVLLLKWACPPVWPAYVRLGLEVGTGAAVYVAVLMGAHRERALTYARLVIPRRSGPRAA